MLNISNNNNKIIEWPLRKNHRVHHVNELIFRGTIGLPDNLLLLASKAQLYRTTCHKIVIRVKFHGSTVLFRDFDLVISTYFGEIVKTPEGKQRIHLFKALPNLPAKYIIQS